MDKKIILPYIAGMCGIIFFGISFTVLGALLPILTTELQLTEVQCSTLAGMLPFGILFGVLSFGPIVDRQGFKPLMIIATLLCSCSIFILSRSHELQTAHLAIFLLGIGGGIHNGAANALISDLSTDKNRAVNLSILGFFFCVGSFSMPMLFAFLNEIYSYRTLLVAISLFIFIIAVFFLFIPFPPAKPRQEGGQFRKALSMLKSPFLILLSLTLFFQSGLESLSQNWTPTFLMHSKGMEMEPAQYALSALIAGMAFSRLVLIWLLKQLKGKTIILLYMTLTMAGAILLYMTTVLFTAVVGAFLIGFGLAATFPVVMGHIGERFKEASGTAFSIALTIALSGSTLLNLLIGQIGIGYYPILLCIAVLCLLTFFLLHEK